MVYIPHYPIENITNTSGNKLVALLQVTSQATDYTPGIMILCAIYLVVFLALKGKGYTVLNCWVAANTALFVLSILMYPLGIIHGGILTISIGMLLLSVLALFVLNN